jgi:hypothetical protein
MGSPTKELASAPPSHSHIDLWRQTVSTPQQRRLLFLELPSGLNLYIALLFILLPVIITSMNANTTCSHIEAIKALLVGALWFALVAVGSVLARLPGRTICDRARAVCHVLSTPTKFVDIDKATDDMVFHTLCGNTYWGSIVVGGVFLAISTVMLIHEVPIGNLKGPVWVGFWCSIGVGIPAVTIGFWFADWVGARKSRDHQR